MGLCGGVTDGIHGLAAVAIARRRDAAGYGLKAALRTIGRWSRSGPQGVLDMTSAIHLQEGTKGTQGT